MTIDSGDPVEHGSEHDGQRRAALLRARCVLALVSTGAVDEPVPHKEDAAADEEAGNDSSVAGRLVGRLLDEVECDRADQDACAEAHDQPDRGQLDAKEERYNGADDE
jgi:hypothetical protein